MEPRKIETAEELNELRRQYGIAYDWHEPDEVGVSAIVHGRSLDTAGFWPRATEEERRAQPTELYLTLQHEGEPIAYVNIAILLRWACEWGHMRAERAAAHQNGG